MATSTIYTTKDSWVHEYHPNTPEHPNNYIKLWGQLGDRRRGVIEYDITSAPVGSIVTSVLMYLYCTRVDYVADAVFNRITGAWTESGVTWNNQPAVSGTHETTLPLLQTEMAWHSYNITDLYKDAKNAGNTCGIRIRVADENSDDNVYWRDRAYSGGSYKSYIVITYTPSDDYYVKTSGNDALDGQSWTNAWATVNKAATTLVDGKTLHIEHGTYNAEPANNKITPQNAGASGIEYKIHTTGGGTGAATVTVEKN